MRIYKYCYVKRADRILLRYCMNVNKNERNQLRILFEKSEKKHQEKQKQEEERRKGSKNTFNIRDIENNTSNLWCEEFDAIKVMENTGWTEGKGLGKYEDGITEPVSVFFWF
jgi:hypothetical protein